MIEKIEMARLSSHEPHARLDLRRGALEQEIEIE
jgi:hypothetical protein